MRKLTLQILGSILALIGLLGFLFSGNEALNNLIHLSLTHNLLHLLSGAIILGVSSNDKYSLWAARTFGILYLLISVLGLINNTLFGLLTVTPLMEVIHFIIAALTLYVGFKKEATQTESASSTQNIEQ
jgi:hypothetical protein